MTNHPVPPYGTNVHPAEDLPGLLAMLDGPAAAVRQRACPDGVLDLGLWLPGALARLLAGSPTMAQRVKERLVANHLAIATVNAFPHGGFHAERVKERVYRPDWSEPERGAYTVDVGRALGHLLSPGRRVVVSTSPGSWKRRDVSPAAGRALARGLVAAAESMVRILDATGVHVVIAPEPEPGCTLETVDETMRWWQQDLSAAMGDRAEALLPHLGICADLCHLAVSERDPAQALRRLAAAGVPVAKIQVSAALVVEDPGDTALVERLRAFDEPRWLHQVGCRGRLGALHHADDLPDLFADLDTWRRRRPWRVHFHAPLHRDEVAGVPTSRELTALALRAVDLSAPDAPVLEVETYTWSAVPGFTGNDDALAENIAAELDWVGSTLANT